MFGIHQYLYLPVKTPINDFLLKVMHVRSIIRMQGPKHSQIKKIAYFESFSLYFAESNVVNAHFSHVQKYISYKIWNKNSFMIHAHGHIKKFGCIMGNWQK